MRTILLFALGVVVLAQAPPRDSLRAQAKQSFDAEIAREKSGDCSNATTTYDSNICYGKAAAAAEQSLKIFESSVHDLLNLTAPEAAVEFSRVEGLWHTYLDAAASAAFHQFQGGTGGASFELETRIRLVRSHLRELDTVYYSALHM